MTPNLFPVSLLDSPVTVIQILAPIAVADARFTAHFQHPSLSFGTRLSPLSSVRSKTYRSDVERLCDECLSLQIWLQALRCVQSYENSSGSNLHTAQLNFGINRTESKLKQGNFSFSYTVVCVRVCVRQGLLLPDVLDDGLHHLLPAVRLHWVDVLHDLRGERQAAADHPRSLHPVQ